MPYVDGFVIPVPKKKLRAYLGMARKAGKVWRDHGALEFREGFADDVPVGKWTSFPRSVKLKRDETIAFAWIVYKSRAHRDRVNDPKHLSQWWGPRGFTNPVCELDLRPDGALRIVMRAPNGTDYPMKGVFREIVAPERLVFTNIAVDQDGNHIIEGLTTVTFTELGGKTKLTLHTTAAALTAQAARMIEGMDAGWTQSIDKLEAYLPRAGS